MAREREHEIGGAGATEKVQKGHCESVRRAKFACIGYAQKVFLLHAQGAGTFHCRAYLFADLAQLRPGVCVGQQFRRANKHSNHGENVIALAAGDYHCLALRRDGTVVAWGTNSVGQTNVPLDATNIVSIAAGSTHSLGLRRDGTVSLWGQIIYSGVTNVPVAATNVVALALGPGAWHALALRGNGTVIDWGNTIYDLSTIPTAAVNIVSIAAGAFHCLALRSDGRVVAWGSNSNGQSAVPSSATNIVAIAAGWYCSAALRAGGTMLVWGSATAPSSSAGFTNLMDVACPFGNNVALLGLRGDGTIAQSGVTTAPAYAKINAAGIAAGGYNGLVLAGAGAPAFSGLPVNRTVVAGSTAYFRSVATGALPLTYQWTCNGTNIPGATNTVLVLTNVQANFAGTYYSLIASNVVDTAVSGPMFLTVLPLRIESAGLLQGPTNALALNFTGLPNGAYSVWYSTNLQTWTSLGHPTEIPPGRFDFVDYAVTSYPVRFYQVRSP